MMNFHLLQASKLFISCNICTFTLSCFHAAKNKFCCLSQLPKAEKEKRPCVAVIRASNDPLKINFALSATAR